MPTKKELPKKEARGQTVARLLMPESLKSKFIQPLMEGRKSPAILNWTSKISPNGARQTAEIPKIHYLFPANVCGNI